MTPRRLLAGLLALAAVLCLTPRAPERGPGGAQGLQVDIALVLAVDCSYSVDAREFRLQMAGLAEAFRRLEVHRAIENGVNGRIAVTLLQWSDDENQLLAIPWTVIDGKDRALAFADQVGNTPRRLAEGGTAIGMAIRFATAALLSAPVSADRRIIDLSADGRNNRGVPAQVARDEAVRRGLTVNGLAIINEWPTLDRYFEQSVVGGPYHFVIVANDYEAYAEAIYRKLLREITGPGTS